MRGIAVESVPIASLITRESPRLQAELPEHVRLLAESDKPFPPIVVHRPTLRVVDGTHRVRASLLRGAERIDARFVDGDERDLFLLAVRLNITHGLPLSRADRRAAAARILRTHPQWSDRAIAEATGLAAKSISTIRRENVAENTTTLNVRIGRDGKRRPLSSIEGRRSAGELIKAQPHTPLRQIAKEAGISLGTAADVRSRVLRGEDPVPQGRTRAPLAAAARRPVTTVTAELPAAPSAARAAEPQAQRDVAAMMRILLSDPSLRFNESGRGLLRWLTGHVLEPREARAVADEAPSHCVGTIADLARRCGESWLELAEQLDRRQRMTG
ncbi:ParB N-terminal domain-containing protein [Streptomyces sp. NPDC002773]|uniref:ParB/RepB/Spo0J family partition protein n=1 Tax=Streptomyces sp. NPDC002773 TaxID=3154430 RepID=UPI00331CDFB0